jgi:PIN domain nuclease of toxin-antitoxin system
LMRLSFRRAGQQIDFPTRVRMTSTFQPRQQRDPPKAATRGYRASAEAVYVSAASIWEIAIKTRLGKMTGDAEEFAAAIDASGFPDLPVTAKHAAACTRVPNYPRPRRLPMPD